MSLDGVWERDGAFDELRDTGLEFCERRKSSNGISSERGLGTLGLDSRDRGVLDLLREASRDLDTTAAMGWLLSRRAGLELFRRAPVASPSIDRLEFICTLLTLPEGMLSRRNAAATPGTRLAVENKGRCSLGCLPLPGLSMEEEPDAPALASAGNAASFN